MGEEDQRHRLTLPVKWRKIADMLVTNTADTGQDRGTEKSQGHETETGDDHVTGKDPGKEVEDRGRTRGNGQDRETDMTETEDDREAEREEGWYIFSSFFGLASFKGYIFSPNLRWSNPTGIVLFVLNTS